jgi:serine/threonine protein kinase
VTFYAIILLGHQYRLVSLTPTLSCLRSASNLTDRSSLYRAFVAASVLDMHIFADVEKALEKPLRQLPLNLRLPAVSRLRKYLMPETMDTDDLERQYLQFRIQNDSPQADPSRLLFIALTDDDTPIVIKFTRRYCAELHALCAKLGRAPQLLAFEHLPGGWCGVAMEYILTAVPLWSIKKDHPEHPRWQQELQEVLTQFHGENLVHGDLRDTNIIVDKDERVLLVDFDWGGKDGETVYPRWDLNSELQNGRTHNDLRIRKEDDERILAYTFSKFSS